MNTPKTYKFVNDFFYVVIRADESRGRGAMICCSGVNLDRFATLTRGRHGLAVSPSMRGPQTTRKQWQLGTRKRGETRAYSGEGLCGHRAHTGVLVY